MFMTLTEQILAAEERLIEALKNGDFDTLEHLLHDDLRFTIPSGALIGKKEDLENLRSGKMKVETMRSEDQSIDFVEDIGIVNVTIHLKAEFDSQQINCVFRYQRIWKRFNDNWQVIAGSGFQIG